MNRTQKEAWCSIIMYLLLVLFGTILFTEIVFLKNFFTRFHRFFALIMIVVAVPLLIFMRTKQSAIEVESDERDNLIKLRAIRIAFIAGWILIAAATLIPRFILGIDGSIALWVLSIINFVIFLFATLTYYVVILIQYRRGGKDGSR